MLKNKRRSKRANRVSSHHNEKRFKPRKFTQPITAGCGFYTVVNTDGTENDLLIRQQTSQHRDIHRKKLVSSSILTPSQQLSNEYLPAEVEYSWNDYWIKNDLFKPSLLYKNKFVMLLPPPNVTGTLHLGHALTVAIQDTIIRFQRMQHNSTLWVPGVDHAGIATQVVVEKNLKKTTGLSRHDLGREKFLEKVWEWKNGYGGAIFKQLQMLGTSLDWSRSRFTLDEMCQEAVKEAFVQLHDKQIIYRDNRIVSWCCTLRSAISSIEIDNLEVTEPTLISIPNYPKKVEVGVIHDFKYELIKKTDIDLNSTPETDDDLNNYYKTNKYNENKQYLSISTTRLETMLGDVAVAINSTDERYKHLTPGDYMLKHPLIPNYYIPLIIDDDLVDPSFGTGCVKITPSHDPNDYACALRHKLPLNISLLNEDGQFNHPFFTKYNHKHRFDVREDIISELSELGLYCGKRPNPMAISMCSRSGDIIEPMIKPQWWVSSTEMASRAKRSANDGHLTFSPPNAIDNWARWLDNSQDWCISRQLWWGHRIPAYYMEFEDDTDTCGPEDILRWVIARNHQEAQIKATQLMKDKYPKKVLKKLRQDDDVLDTWFSSGLFPFSVMGWPKCTIENDETAETGSEQNKDLIRFFPNTLLETGNDILFFWVARMVMLSQELTGQLPFNHIYLHSLIRDKSGRKMSKSLGNVIDPIDVINGVNLEELHAKLLTSNLHQDEIQKARLQQTLDFPEGIPPCGSDSLRYGLLYYTRQSGDINLDIKTIISAKHFHNKIYQASRFALINFRDNTDIFTVPNGMADVVKQLEVQYEFLLKEHENTQHIDISSLKHGTLEQQWILNRLAQTIENVNHSLVNYQLGEASQHLQKFFLEDLCSTYLEISKTIVKKHNWHNNIQTDNPHYHPILANTSLTILHHCLDTFYKLLHPISPFLTEQLYFSLPGHENRCAQQCAELDALIVDPISNIISTYQAQGKNIKNNVELNSFIYTNLIKNKTRQQLRQMKQYIDPEIFNIQMYKEQIDTKRTKFGSDILQHDTLVTPADHLLSAVEIQNELNMLQKQYQSGSVSIQRYPIIPHIDQPDGENYDDSAILLNQLKNNNKVSEEMNLLNDIIEKIRQVKARLQIPNHIKPNITLEYLMNTEKEGGTVTPNDEFNIVSNFALYQHIVSILGFVSTPNVTITMNKIDDPSSSNATTPNSIKSIKQYISERLLVHINFETNPDCANDETNSALGAIDFSPELVKSEKRLNALSVDSETLFQSIQRTKDNPKVPEKVKVKNQNEYKSIINEIAILQTNIPTLRHIVKPLEYNFTLQADLHEQVTVLQKNKAKLKKEEQIAAVNAEIEKLYVRLQECETNIKKLTV